MERRIYLSINIDSQVMNEDKEMLEDMILSAATVYDFSSNGFTIGTLDLQNAIQYL